ncbi:unnamed protein product [Polarella glacialis]|uniref:Uncharacterized protein n=1 Tax=Polarella glacialis TaxID=89957 RepID=A0A813G706_POLGL|nr:unnamed protein product [Polarella glacialis]
MRPRQLWPMWKASAGCRRRNAAAMHPKKKKKNKNKNKNKNNNSNNNINNKISHLASWRAPRVGPPCFVLLFACACELLGVEALFADHTANATDVFFNHDGSLLASSSCDDTLKLYATSSWTAVHTFTNHHTSCGFFKAGSFSNDGSLLATGSDSIMKVYATSSWTAVGYFGNSAGRLVRAVSFNPSSSLLVSASEVTSLKVHATSTWDLVQELPNYGATIRAIAFNRDGSLLATASDDQWLKMYGVSSWTFISYWPGSGTETDLSFNHDSGLLATSSDGYRPRVYKTSNWRQASSFPELGSVRSAACCIGKANTILANSISFNNDGSLLAFGSSDHTLQVWATSSWTVTETLLGRFIAFSDDGNLLASTPVTPLTVMRQAEAMLGDLVASLENKSSVSTSTPTGEVQLSKLELAPGQSAAIIEVSNTDVVVSIPRSVIETRSGSTLLLLVATSSLDMASTASLNAISLQASGFTKKCGLASQMVDVRLYERLGHELNLLETTGLETPVLITVLANWSSSPGSLCAFWDEAAWQWSVEGLTESASVSGALVCASTHLTIFAALRKEFLDKFVEQLKCTNVRMLALHSGSDGSWTYRPGGLLLWLALIASSGFVIYSNKVDVAMKKTGLWDDGFFITQVPKNKRTPMGCSFFREVLRSVPQRCRWCRDSCAAAAVSLERMTLLRKRLELGTTEAGLHAFLSRNSGLTVRTINRHYWNRDGFVQGDLAVEKSMPLAHMFEESTGHLAPWFLELYGETLGFAGRVRLLFQAVHPILQVLRFDLETSAVRRSMLLVDEILGGLVISALFFSASASALSVNSSALCAQMQYDATRFVLIGLVSSSVVRLPLAIAAYMTLRFFVHEDLSAITTMPKKVGKQKVGKFFWGSEAQKSRQLRRWQLADYLIWAVGSTYRLLCVFFLVAFLNDLHGLDEWKWVLSFVCVLLRSILLLPAAHALLLTLAVELVRRSDPQFVAGGHPQLGFSPEPSLDVHPKVLDLATRSMTVDDLLQFYGKLGTEVMPHFDPRKSTTHDVVRQAIIPLSGAGVAGGVGSAYATVVANGQPRLPQKLVTHNWSNIFSHLIAAVLADCMNCQTFEKSLAMLLEPKGLEELRKRLANKLHNRYWICIFSVNQHAGICATPPEADSHGMPIQPCTCLLEKHWTGDQCEMNKFDDMMAYTRTVVPGFAQVVAVDIELACFSRIWCIAELIEARHSNIRQVLKIYSDDLVEQFRAKIQAFDVRNAQASFARDRDLILGKLISEEHKDAFNEEVKDLILNRSHGLLSLWSSHAADVGLTVLGGAAVEVPALFVPGMLT